MIEQGQRYLITCDCYFLAPDGEEYRGVWGKVVTKTTAEVLGFTPQRPSTNWFAVVGEGEKQTIIAGCQIHYVVKCDTKPTKLDGVLDVPGQASNNRVLNKIFYTE